LRDVVPPRLSALPQAYMSRLGLWGPGSAFADFQAFLDSMKKRGVSFLEMLAMEMKAEGMYVARALSFRQAPFACAQTP
jgi:P-loop containing NTP hydrolase pore-1